MKLNQADTAGGVSAAGGKSSVTRRKPALPLALMVIGMAVVLFHGVMQEYAYGAFMTDGIYIPNSSHKAPSGSFGEISHTFRIYNLRSRPLQVSAEPDCECTGVSWEKATVAPFGWKNLTAKMMVHRGETNKSVSIAIRTDRRDKPFLFAHMGT